jgi:hypothetical protein
MGCPGGCDNPPKFTLLGNNDFAKTLAAQLIGVADSLRDLRVSFGLRPYNVRIIRTRWTSAMRGIGDEFITFEMILLPTPNVRDLSTLTEIVLPVGLDETGGVLVNEISGRYSEQTLRGLDSTGAPIGKNENIFYEIEFPRLDGGPSEKRRFSLRSAPMYRADKFDWQIRLEKSNENRTPQGVLR